MITKVSSHLLGKPVIFEPHKNYVIVNVGRKLSESKEALEAELSQAADWLNGPTQYELVLDVKA